MNEITSAPPYAAARQASDAHPGPETEDENWEPYVHQPDPKPGDENAWGEPLRIGGYDESTGEPTSYFVKIPADLAAAILAGKFTASVKSKLKRIIEEVLDE